MAASTTTVSAETSTPTTLPQGMPAVIRITIDVAGHLYRYVVPLRDTQFVPGPPSVTVEPCLPPAPAAESSPVDPDVQKRAQDAEFLRRFESFVCCVTGYDLCQGEKIRMGSSVPAYSAYTCVNTIIREKDQKNRDLAYWLLDQGVIEPKYGLDLFEQAAMSGNIDMMRALIDHFDLKTPAARSTVIDSDGTFLSTIAAIGDVDVGQFLSDIFDLTRDDVIAGDNLVFRSAAAMGRLDFLKWLTEEFDLTARDAFARSGRALYAARDANQADVIEWIVNKFVMMPRA